MIFIPLLTELYNGPCNKQRIEISIKLNRSFDGDCFGLRKYCEWSIVPSRLLSIMLKFLGIWGGNLHINGYRQRKKYCSPVMEIPMCSL